MTEQTFIIGDEVTNLKTGRSKKIVGVDNGKLYFSDMTWTSDVENYRLKPVKGFLRIRAFGLDDAVFIQSPNEITLNQARMYLKRHPESQCVTLYTGNEEIRLKG